MRRHLRHQLAFFRLLILITCLGLILAYTSPAQAHANLVRSDPETGAVLVQSPEKVTLEFSEPLDSSFSKARLADANLATVVEGPGVIDPEDNHILILDIPPLSTGAYNVIWQARSVIDGHITTGVVTFSVGAAASSISLLPQPGTPDPSKVRPPWMDTLLRWLAALSAALGAGSLLFAMLVWRPAYRAWDSPVPRNDQIAGQRLRAFAIAGAAGLAAVSLALVILQAWQVSKGVFQVSFGEALGALLGLSSGWVFWLRIILLGLLLFISSRLSLPGEGPAVRWGIAALLALAVLLTISLQSHAAALDSPLPVFSDWVHLTAMAAWLGGLPALFILLRQTEMPAQGLVPKFSRLALVSVAVLAVSGLYNASVHVRTLQALLDTIYGEAIAGKTILFFILFCIGAINLLILSPRLSGSQQALRRLGITVRFEMAIGLLLLVLVALLTGVSPAYEALQARQRLGYIGRYSDDGVGLDLWIAPTRVGENEVAVNVRGLREPPAGSPPQVLLRFQPTSADLGEFQVDTVESSPSRFTARGSYLTIAGVWRVKVILRRAGANDVTHDFTVQVQDNPYLTDIVNPIPSTGNSISAGKTLYESDCLACHGAQGKGDGPAGLALRPPPADLTIHTAPGVHPDGQLYEWITNGYPGSAMPAFTGRLNDEERWNLVNYIRTLSRK